MLYCIICSYRVLNCSLEEKIFELFEGENCGKKSQNFIIKFVDLKWMKPERISYAGFLFVFFFSSCEIKLYTAYSCNLGCNALHSSGSMSFHATRTIFKIQQSTSIRINQVSFFNNVFIKSLSFFVSRRNRKRKKSVAEDDLSSRPFHTMLRQVDYLQIAHSATESRDYKNDLFMSSAFTPQFVTTRAG